MIPSSNQTSLARIVEGVDFSAGESVSLNFEESYEFAFIVSVVVIDCDGQREAEKQNGSDRIGKWTRPRASKSFRQKMKYS